MGPVVVYNITKFQSFLLCTLDGKLRKDLLEYGGLKPAVIRTSQDNVATLPQLRQVIHVGTRLNQYTLSSAVHSIRNKVSLGRVYE